jgi:ubiquinone/menaquinone biosynthesis C-methylase UbiE
VTDAVAAGYDVVYAAWRSSPYFHELWARHAVDGQVAEGFEHLDFASLPELDRMRAALDLGVGERMVDLACGAGGPGAWIAHVTRAALFGIDLSSVGARLAADRADQQCLSHAAFAVGSVDALPLRATTAAGAISLDSLQYVPDKRATFAEVARVLRPNGRFVFTAFEVDVERVRGVPVLGADPVPDYSVVLRDAGFRVDTYDETPNWNDRLVAAYSAVVAAEETLRPELGNDAMDALLLEMTLTLDLEPYRRRVLAVATNEVR